MPRTLSDQEIDRIRKRFRELLGRDLTRAEQRYLGLSSVVVSIDERDLADPFNRRKLKVVNRD